MRKAAIILLSGVLAIEVIVGGYVVFILRDPKFDFTFSQAAIEVIVELPNTVTEMLGLGHAPVWLQVAWWPFQLLLLLALIFWPKPRRTGAK